MTGGRVVILGQTGKNFAAGMSGGIAYVLDEKHDLYKRLNKTGLVMSTLKELHDIQELESLIRQHVEATGSVKGKAILEHFDVYVPAFKKIIPRDYERMIAAIAAFEGKGESREQAEIEAFTAAVKH
jgi:glutamate synthase (ferredoxin)